VTSTSTAPAKRTMLDRIESLGNKVPHPAIIFLGLCVLVIVLSALLAAFDVKVTYEVAEPPTVTATQDYETGSSVADYHLPPPGYEPRAARSSSRRRRRSRACSRSTACGSCSRRPSATSPGSAWSR
jgi:AbgT putative transporter family